MTNFAVANHHGIEAIVDHVLAEPNVGVVFRRRTIGFELGDNLFGSFVPVEPSAIGNIDSDRRIEFLGVRSQFRFLDPFD